MPKMTLSVQYRNLILQDVFEFKQVFTLTFLRLHVKHPPRDFRCGFLLTKPALRRAMSARDAWTKNRSHVGEDVRECQASRGIYEQHAANHLRHGCGALLQHCSCA